MHSSENKTCANLISFSVHMAICCSQKYVLLSKSSAMKFWVAGILCMPNIHFIFFHARILNKWLTLNCGGDIRLEETEFSSNSSIIPNDFTTQYPITYCIGSCFLSALNVFYTTRGVDRNLEKNNVEKYLIRFGQPRLTSCDFTLLSCVWPSRKTSHSLRLRSSRG